MEVMIAKWLSGKIFGLVCFCLAVLGLICTPIAIWEGVSLHGLSIPFPFGWHITLVDGALKARDDAIAARDKAIADWQIAHNNEGALKAEVGRLNANITQLGIETKARQDETDKRLAAEQARRARLQADIAAIDAMPVSGSSPAAAVIDVDAIIKNGVH